MAKLSIAVNGRNFPVECGEGEEERIQELASYVDTRLRDLQTQLGPVGESRLFLMNSLIMADEILERKEELEALKKNTTYKKKPDSQLSEDSLAEMIEKIAKKIETLVEKINKH